MKNDRIQDCLYTAAFRDQYDRKADSITEWMVELIRDKKNGKHDRDNAILEIIHVEKDSKELSGFEYFGVDCVIQSDKIHVSVYLSDEFSDYDHLKINRCIYVAIRHNIENKDGFKCGQDNKYDDLDDLIKSYDIEEWIKIVSERITSDSEIDSYVRSITYVAKERELEVFDVIEQVLKQALFNNNSDMMYKAVHDIETAKIIQKTRMALRDGIQKYKWNFKERWI